LHEACANITAIAAGTLSTPYSSFCSSISTALVLSDSAAFLSELTAVEGFLKSTEGLAAGVAGLERARMPQNTAKAKETPPYA